VIGLLSGVVSAAARQLGHIISFSVTLTMMLGVNAYIFYKCRQKKGKFWRKWGPLFCTALAGALIMLDLFRHVLADHDIWKPGPFPGSSEYRPGCKEESMKCLSLTGILITVIATYTGFILLFIGTMWSANIITKLKQIRKQWKNLRSKM